MGLPRILMVMVYNHLVILSYGLWPITGSYDLRMVLWPMVL